MSKVIKLEQNQIERKKFCLRSTFQDELIQDKQYLVVTDGVNQMLLNPLEIACDGIKKETGKDYDLVEYSFTPNKEEIETSKTTGLYEVQVKEEWLTPYELNWLNRIHWTWFNVLREFINSSKMVEIINEVGRLRNKGDVFPRKEEVYSILLQPYNKIKVVFFDAESLLNNENFAKCISAIYNYTSYSPNFKLDIKKLEEQGVFFLPLSLSRDAKRSHDYIWKDFIIKVLQELNNRKESVIFVKNENLSFNYMGQIKNQHFSYITNFHNSLLSQTILSLNTKLSARGKAIKWMDL